MPRSDILHAVHELTNFKDNFVEENFGIADSKHYYHTNKRKRKTNLPQKRELSEDEMEDAHSSGHDSMEHDEPINLMKRDTSSSHNSEQTCDRITDNVASSNGLSIEQNRMYTILLNYLLMKHHTQSDSKDALNLNPLNKLIERHPDIKIPGLNNHPGVSRFVPSLLAPIVPPAFGCNMEGKPSGGQDYSMFDGTTGFCTTLKANPFRNGWSQNNAWKQSIVHTINTCINNIPIPKSGYENYEAMLLCYKTLIEKACALQQAVEMYLNLLQNTSIPENLPSDTTTECTSTPFSALISARPGWNQAPTVAPILHTSNPNLGAPLSNEQRNVQDIYSGSTINNDWKNDDATFSKIESNAPADIRLNTYPVDLTKNEKTCRNIQLTNNLRAPSVSSNCELTEKLEKGNVHFLSRLFNNSTNELATHSDYNGLSSQTSSTDFNVSPSSDKFDFSPRSLKDQATSNTSRLPASIPSLENNYIACHVRSGLPLRRKSYFKGKRLKKTFSSGTNSVNNENCEGSQVKKSNFRGTSEEENRVAPDFHPIEINGQIVLCEAHPNVKLSKDIFYSLIVKSSGSATRLIRLLMKSFFTQDELAASSLSGEGIYKQRLEPSVTEAIKIFIRRRHPQLKTGSINLCMTDVCVQARRVANNQRSRQHPIRLGNFPATNTSNSGAPSPEQSTESSGVVSCSLLGLKDRTTPATSTTVSCTTGPTMGLSVPPENDVHPFSTSQCPSTPLLNVNSWSKTNVTETSAVRFSPQEWVQEKLNTSATHLDDVTPGHQNTFTNRDNASTDETKSSPLQVSQTIPTNDNEVGETS